MEHRWHKRSDVDLAATVYQAGNPISTGKVVNISKGGMRINFDNSHKFKTDESIDLNIHTAMGEANTPRFKGVIIYHNGNAIGIMTKSTSH